MLCWSNQVGAHKVTRENMRERREGEVWGRARHCFEARRDGVLAKRQGGRKSNHVFKDTPQIIPPLPSERKQVDLRQVKCQTWH